MTATRSRRAGSFARTRLNATISHLPIAASTQLRARAWAAPPELTCMRVLTSTPWGTCGATAKRQTVGTTRVSRTARRAGRSADEAENGDGDLSGSRRASRPRARCLWLPPGSSHHHTRGRASGGACRRDRRATSRERPRDTHSAQASSVSPRLARGPGVFVSFVSWDVWGVCVCCVVRVGVRVELGCVCGRESAD